MQHAEIYDKVVAILKSHTKADVALTREAHIASDLAIDSVEMFDILMEIEETYDISFSVEEAADLETVGALVDAIAKRVEG